MNKIRIVNLLVLLFLVSPASAEFYRYKDLHGNVIYTDDLSKVPKAQRSQATMYDESYVKTPPAQIRQEEKAERSPGQSADEMAALEKEAQRLLAVKERLDREYHELSDENAKLKAEQKEAVTPDQIKETNKKVVGYNTRFQSYQEKHSAYEADVKAYNERLRAAQPQTASGGNGQSQ